SFQVMVLDTIAPTVVGLQNVIVYLDSTGTVSIDSTFIDNGSTDNCGIATMVLDTADFDCANLLAPVNGTMTVTDVNGNVSTFAYTVTTIDSVAPVVAVQNLTVYLDSNGNATITANDIDNGTTDNCLGSLVLAIDSSAFSCAQAGDTVIGTFTATDPSSNSGSAPYEVYILDTILPAAIAKDTTLYLDADGLASITAADINNNSFDNCGIQSIAIDTSSFDCASAGDTVDGILTVTDANGLVSTDSFQVIVLDTVSPNAIAQNIAVYLDSMGNASIAAGDIDAGSNDSCGIQSLVIDSAAFDCSHVGDTVMGTLTVTDVNGNVSITGYQVYVFDTIAPVTAVQLVTIYLDSNGLATTTAADVDNGSTDNCSGQLTLSIDSTSFDCTHAGDTITGTFTATDGSGNAAATAYQVAVRDTIAPAALSQDIPVYLDASGQASITAMGQQLGIGALHNPVKVWCFGQGRGIACRLRAKPPAIKNTQN
ncbi:MAG: hypothetical protein AAGB22_11630, partial [Bacteroidota bacterium]